MLVVRHSQAVVGEVDEVDGEVDRQCKWKLSVVNTCIPHGLRVAVRGVASACKREDVRRMGNLLLVRLSRLGDSG